MDKRLKIGFLTVSDARSRRSWSGINYFMSQALQRQCGEVVFLGPIDTRLIFVGKVLNFLSLRVLGRKYDYTRSRWYARRVSALASDRIKHRQLDCIVASAAAGALAYLDRPGIPIVFVSDTTFSLINSYYDSFSNYLPISVKDGRRMSKTAMELADIVTFPSQWAANSAIHDYGISPEKVHVIPMGANLDRIPPPEIAQGRRRSGECRLLFLGVDWKRKGGDIALEALLCLEEKYGIKAHLTVCGCQVPGDVSHPRMRVIGFLDKGNPAQAEQLSQLFIETDYFLLPTRKECFGIVFCEASAYGVPSITTDTGGVAGAVAQGRNGYLLPESARGDAYAKVIAEIESSDEYYKQLCRTSRSEYDNRVNWDIWAGAICSLIASVRGNTL